MGTDLFISYVTADSVRAESVACKLDAIGHHVVMDGGRLHHASELAADLRRRGPQDTTIVILSPSYLATLAEVPAAVELVRRRAMGGERAVVAVRVRSCTPADVLPDVPFVDLAGVDEPTAKALLRRSLPPPTAARGAAPQTAVPHELHGVFKRSGVPTVTFVEPECFGQLTGALRQAGRGIVMRGPSGIGKTSALRRALANLAGDRAVGEVTMLDAASRDDVERVRAIASWHRGTVAIDGFHLLAPTEQERIADYLKHLAHTERDDVRLVLAGVPAVGSPVLDNGFDAADSVELVTLGKVRDEVIDAMVASGEQALNVSLTDRGDLVRAAGGSLQVAQNLCYEVCARAGIFKQQDRLTPIAGGVYAAIDIVVKGMGDRFGGLVAAFQSAGDAEEDTGANLLLELARSHQVAGSRPRSRASRPQRPDGGERVIRGEFIAQVRAVFPECDRFVRYDSQGSRLALDDPQLAVYLRAICGIDRNRVVVCYSHADRKWLARLRVHLTSAQSEEGMEVWDDTMIGAGDDWRNEIARAVDSANVAVLLVSADFLASEFIVKNELPPLLRRAKDEGTTILPIVVAPCRYERSRLGRFQAVNDPARSLMAMMDHEQESVFKEAAQAVEDAIRDTSQR